MKAEKKNEKNASEGYRSLHKGCGIDYHTSFKERPYRRMMWTLEKKVLSQIVNNYAYNRNIHGLDFACGTGRILYHISSHVQTIIGVDISESMIEIAEQNLPENAELINADITIDETPLQGKQFDIITAFRFFANAEDELRDQAMRVLKEHLKPEGIIVFNNHQNHSSPIRRIGKKLGLANAKNMSPKEVNDLLNKHSLTLDQKIGFGLLPFHDRFMPLPNKFVEFMEWQLSRARLADHKGQNIIYIAKINTGQ